ncbi:MAG: spore maturation protein [Thermovenabulum sp.]|uniref:spore maturation protein n=1 Tax=Thermovenabulum sp. TaxID=3100335 RepID=UPI003C7C0F13
MLPKIVNTLSQWAVPCFIIFIISYGYIKKVKIYEVFIEGAAEGFATAVKVIPYLIAVLVSVGIFRASGAMDFLITFITPFANFLGIPSETLPMALIRPLSGGGAQGIMTEIFKTYGPDSFIGKVAATMNSATDTTLYIIALYFGSIGVKNTRHALFAGLIADTVGLIVAAHAVRILLGG